MNNSIWILISFYSLGLGFLIGMYYMNSTEPFERAEAESPFMKILGFIFSPLSAIVWLFIWIKRVFFGLNND